MGGKKEGRNAQKVGRKKIQVTLFASMARKKLKEKW